MLKSQKIQLRQSEIRQRLNTIAGMEADAVTGEIRTESDKLRKELDTNETAFRTAVEAEEAETRQRGGQAGGDGELREFRSVAARVRLSHYLDEAAGGGELGQDTPEAELRAACKLQRGFVPWAAFDPGEARGADGKTEYRADTATAAPTDVKTEQDMILGRVFAMTAASFLGVSMMNVPSGDKVFPVLSAGNAAAVKAKGAEHGATAGTIDATVLQPTSVRARYLFRQEDLARMGDALETALRADMAQSIGDAMDAAILTGDGTAPNPSGFLDTSSGPLTIPADAGTLADFAAVIAAVASGVDGKFAHNLMQVRGLVNPAAYAHAAALFTTSGDASGADYLVRRAGGFRASANMPAVASNNATGLLYRSGAAGASAAMPVWSGVRILRDDLTRAAHGEVAVTANAMFGFAVLRSAAYAAFKLKVS